MGWNPFGKGKPAPQPQYTDFIPTLDEITGTETKMVVGPDGRKQLKTSRLPRSAEEQMLYDKAMKMQQEALTNIQYLSEIDPLAAEEFQGFLNNFKSNEERQLNEALAEARANQDRYLSKTGLRNSTYASGLRNSLHKNEYKARQDIADRTTLYANQLRDQAIQRQQNLFGLGQNIYQNDFNKAFANNNIASSNQTFGAMQMGYGNQLKAHELNQKPSFGEQFLLALAGGGSQMGASYLSGGYAAGKK